MAYTKYSLTPADNNAAPPNGAPEGMLPSGVNDTMRDMMAQIRDVGDGIRGGTYTMTAPVITGGSVSGVTFSSAAATITGGSVSGVTFSSSAATITGGSVTGVTFSSSAATITGGSVSGITDLAIADGGTGASTAADARINLGVDNYGMLKNRIINGDMKIDQRNAGSSVTPTSSQYTLDRWAAGLSAASKYSVQQNAGSVTPPTGFTNYFGVTSTSAYSISTSDFFLLEQFIEGFNIADLGWGTANAQPVTISFWVRSSLTGTFGGGIANSAQNRSYPFSYTINAANTWEQKSVTIAGDASGTWLTNNGTGIRLRFGLGVGSTFSGTAGAWAASNLLSATGATSVVGTNGATFYITGVQLEKGSNATSFEYRQYGQELSLCQRYYGRYQGTGSGNQASFGTGYAYTTSAAVVTVQFPQAMRASATVSQSQLAVTDSVNYDSNVTSIATQYVGPFSSRLLLNTAGGMTVGETVTIVAQINTSGYVDFSAEL